MLLPAGYAGWLIWRYGVNVPIGDHWGVVSPVLEGLTKGTYKISYLFYQDNESRPAVPRLAYALAARLTGWNTRVEMAGSFAMLLWMGIGCWLLLRRSMTTPTLATIVPVFVANLILYTPAQHDALLWGAPLICYVPPFCLVTGLVALQYFRSDALAWTIVTLCALVSTYSHAIGMLLWALFPAALWQRARTRGTRQPLAGWAVFAFVCAVALWCYFRDYHAIAAHPPMRLAFTRPMQTLEGYSVFIGSALGYGPDRALVAMRVGAAVAALFATTCLVMIVGGRRSGDLGQHLPFVVLAGYGFIAGMPAAASRAGRGSDFLLMSHYITFSAWAAVGTLLLLVSCRLAVSRQAPRSWTARTLTGLLAIACAGVVYLHWQAVPDALFRVKGFYRERLVGKAALQFVEVAPDPVVKTYLASGGIEASRVKAKVAVLRSGQYLLPEPVEWVEPISADCRYGLADHVAQKEPGQLTVSGWAYLPDRDEPADGMVLTTGEGRLRTAVAYAMPQVPRLDVAASKGKPNAAGSGWALTLSWPQGTRVEAWAFDAWTMRAYPLCRYGGDPTTLLDTGVGSPSAP